MKTLASIQEIKVGDIVTFNDGREILDVKITLVDYENNLVDIEAAGEASFLMGSDFERGYITMKKSAKPKTRKEENIEIYMVHLSGLKTDYQDHIFIQGIEPKTGYYRLVIFGPRGYKPQINHNFKTFEARAEYVAKIHKRIDSSIEDQKQRDQRAKSENDQLQPGAILYSSWGYEQTNIDFYQIVARSGSTVTLQEIGQDKNHDNRGDSGNCVANPEIKKGEHFKKRLSQHGGIKMNSYKYASLWDGRPLSWSSWN